MKARKTLYKKCRVERDGVKEKIWLPLNLAVKGQMLKIKGVEGWEVIEIEDGIFTINDIDKLSRGYETNGHGIKEI